MGNGCGSEFCSNGEIGDGKTSRNGMENQTDPNPMPAHYCSIAVLGGVAAGKSTLIKNMILTYDELDFKNEFNVPIALRNEIALNTRDAIVIFQKLNRAFPKEYNMSKDSKAAQDAYAALLKVINRHLRYQKNDINADLSFCESFDTESIRNAEILWLHSKVFESIHRDYNGYYSGRNYYDYLKRLNKIFSPNYKAYYKDVLKLYQHTKDVSKRQIEVVLENDQDLAINLYDVSGDMRLAQKWVTVTKGADCLVFCVSLLSYYRRAYSDRDQSELEFQLKIFDGIINGKIEKVDFLTSAHNTFKHLDSLDPPSIRNGKTQYSNNDKTDSKNKQNDRFAYYLSEIYKNVSQIPLLFLIFFDNDGFKEIIKEKPLSHHCIDYDGNDTESDALNFIRNKFIKLIPANKFRHFETEVTSGISGSKMRHLCMNIIHHVIETKFS